MRTFFFIGRDNIEGAAREALYRAGGSIEISDRVRPELVKVILPPVQSIAERIDCGENVLFRTWDHAEIIHITRKFREDDSSLGLFRYEKYEQDAIRLYC